MINQKAMPAGRQGFIPVIIILVVLIGFVGVYYLGTLKPNKIIESSTPTPVTSVEPTSDPTANWKTFSDIKYAFKYPSSWQANSLPLNTYQVINVSTDDNSVILSLVEKLPGLGFENKTLKKEEKIVLGGVQVTKWIYQDLASQNKEIWISLRENSGDFLTIIYKSDSSIELIDQILSTFKFVN